MAPTLSERALRIALPGRDVALGVSLVLVALIAVADYLTGYELTLSILYFAPIFVATWRCGVHTGIVVSGCAVIAWMTSDILAGHHYSHPFYRVWEGSIKLITWSMFAVLLDRLKTVLDRSDQRFVTVLDSLDAIVYVADLESGMLLYANPHCRSLLGVKEGDPATGIEARWQPPVHEVFAPHRLLGADEHLPGGFSAEFRDAERSRWYMAHGRAIRWVDGRLVRLQIATDVTERREAELQARQRQGRMESAARLIMLGEMASTLAHELNQPLAAIANYNRGALRLLQSDGWNVEELRAALDKCASQAERAGRIIHRVRDLMRRREPHRTACRLSDVVDHVCATLEVELADANVRLTVDLDAGLPAMHADGVLIEQALLNLCRNAVEAMHHTDPARRDLAIRAHLRAGDEVEVRISDTGCGVPPEVAANRFELFFTTREQGTGIGLHICRSVLEAHQSRLWVEPRPGGGSVFCFTLPAVAP